MAQPSRRHIAPGDTHLLQMTHTLAFIIPVKHAFSSPHLKRSHIPSADTPFLRSSPRGKSRYLWYLYPSVSCWNEFSALHNKRLSHSSGFWFFIWSFNAFCKWAHKSLLRSYCIFEIAEKWFPCAHTSCVRVESYALVGWGGGRREVNVTNYLCDVLKQNPLGFPAVCSSGVFQHISELILFDFALSSGFSEAARLRTFAFSSLKFRS